MLGASPCQPFIFDYRYDSGGYHFIVARGAYANMAGKYLLVINPLGIFSDAILMFYDDYKVHSTRAWYSFR
jgi:hypothetical protein